MGTAAEFCGEIPHLNHTYAVAVFFPKQSHGACFLRLVKSHDRGLYGKMGCDFLIDNLFHLIQLFLGHCGKMTEIKTKPACVHIGACLFHVGTKHRTQSFMKQMGCTVVLTGSRSFRRVYGKFHLVPVFNHSFGHPADMAYLASGQMNRILYFMVP